MLCQMETLLETPCSTVTETRHEKVNVMWKAEQLIEEEAKELGASEAESPND